MADQEKLEQIWDRMVEDLAKDNHISKCQASCLALQGLLFLDDVEKENAAPAFSSRIKFSDIESALLDTLLRKTCNICSLAK